MLPILIATKRRSHDSLQGRETGNLVCQLQIQGLERRVEAEGKTGLSHEARGPSLGARLQEEDVESGIDGVLPRMRYLP